MDGSYRPQSPDLSSFFSSPSKTQQPYYPQHPQPAISTSYAPRSPVIPSFNTSPAPQPPTSTYNQGAYSNDHQHQSTPPPPPLHPQQGQHALFNNPPFPGYNHNTGPGGNTSIIHHNLDDFDAPFQIPDLPPQHSFTNNPNAPAAIPSYYTPQQYADPSHFKSEDSAYTSASAGDPYISSPIDTNTISPFAMTSRRGTKNLSTHSSDPFPPSLPPQQQHFKDPNPNNIEIRTKFPVARIKRIMQADEEVGKVAQVTPVAVSKALELFMIALVTGAAEKAKEKGGKRVTAQHLKQVVLGSPEQFDFLQEIVGRVAEAPEGEGGRKRKGKAGEEASESSDEEAARGKRKGKGGRRKKNED